MLFNFLS